MLQGLTKTIEYFRHELENEKLQQSTSFNES